MREAKVEYDDIADIHWWMVDHIHYLPAMIYAVLLIDIVSIVVIIKHSKGLEQDEVLDRVYNNPHQIPKNEKFFQPDVNMRKMLDTSNEKLYNQSLKHPRYDSDARFDLEDRVVVPDMVEKYDGLEERLDKEIFEPTLDKGRKNRFRKVLENIRNKN